MRLLPFLCMRDSPQIHAVRVLRHLRIPLTIQVHHLLRRRIDKLLRRAPALPCEPAKAARLPAIRAKPAHWPACALPGASALNLIARQQTIGAGEQHGDQQHGRRDHRADHLPARLARLGIGGAHHAAVVDPLDVKENIFVGERDVPACSPRPACAADPARFIWFSNSLSNAVASVAILPDLTPSTSTRSFTEAPSARSLALRDGGLFRISSSAGRTTWRVSMLRPPGFRQGLKTLFDLAVLERHEGDDHRASARLHQPGNGFEQRVQLFLLAGSPRCAAP